MMDQEHLSPAAIAEYISYGQCGRYAKHRMQDIDGTKRHSAGDFREAFTPLNILLSAAGAEFENGITATAAQHTREDHNLETPDDAPFSHDHGVILDSVRTAIAADSEWDTDPIMIVQASVTGQINGRNISGDADNIFIWATPAGAEIRVIDLKRTSEQRVYHQVQAATYAALIRQLISETTGISSDEVTITGGVITQETTVMPLTRENLPEFDVEPRIADLTRLLSADSSLMTALDTPLDEVSFRLDSKCDTCPYNEGCVTESFEDGHIRLLGLTEAQQAHLLDHDITTIADVADLCRTPDEDQWKPTAYVDGTFRSETYRELARTPNIGELLPQLVFRAEALLDALQAEPDGVSDRPQTWLPGSGKCALPDDEPSDQAPGEHEWMGGSMVRVYLNVQNDHLRDRLIQLSARVTATASDTEPQRISVLSDAAPEDENEADRQEAKLLEQFWARLYAAIQDVTDGINFTDTPYEQPPLHFYVYTDTEHKALVDAFDRHREKQRVNAFRAALETGERQDDGMVSTIRSEIESHIILETPSPGLVHSYRELHPPSRCYRKPRRREDWTYSPPDTTRTYDLRRVFGRRLFNIGVGADLPTTQPPGRRRQNQSASLGTTTEEGVGVDINPSSSEAFDGINTRMRYGAGIPLAYLWAAVGRIDADWEDKDTIDSSALAEFELQTYRYRDADAQNELITPEDVETLGRHLCDVLEHLERSLVFKDSLYSKTPFPIETLVEDTFQAPTLAEGAEQYLAEEYHADREEKYELYRKFPVQRMLTGQSIPVYVTGVEELSDRKIRVEGHLWYDNPELFDDAGAQIKRACRKKGSQGTSSGSWMVANPFSPGQIDTEVTRPYKIEQGANATVEQLDTDNDRVQLTLTNFWHEGGMFGQSHANWTTDPDRASDDNRLYVDTQEWLILDPQTDDITAERAQRALDHAETNALHQQLEAIRHGEIHHPETPFFDAPPAPASEMSPAEELAEWLDEEYGEDTYPSTEQQSFITEITKQFVALQGPPGTGKTAATMAPTLLTRLYAGAYNGVSVNGLVTAPSNTAIDQLLADTAELLNTMADEGPLAAADLDIELVRIGEQPPEPVDGVTYIDYNNDDHAGRIDRIIQRLQTTGRTRELKATVDEPEGYAVGDSHQSGLTAFDDSSDPSEGQSGTEPTDDPLTLVFATTTRAWRFLKTVAPGSSPDDHEMATQQLWHLLAVDEASMLELPNFLLAGSALQPNGQVLVGGDHRQLPPVQKRDWDEVRRRDIRATAAYLSTLDYIRLLRGDAVLPDDQAEWFVCDRNPSEVAIPLIRLDTTYRFDEWTAQFVQDTVYEQDGIEYTSGRETLNPIAPGTDDLQDPLAPLFDSTTTVALLTYGQDGADDSYQQSNPIESAVTEALTMSTDTAVDIGVVTPHNAQRGRLQSLLQQRGYAVNQADRDEDDTALQDIQVETVNRFQGGERDLMVVNATVSDPNYIAAEDEFLLEENRINVSFTRHREQLVVIAPETLLGYLPEDPELYESARLWKGLASTLGADPTLSVAPEWQGELGEFLAAGGFEPPVPERIRKELKTTVTLYTNTVIETE